MICEPGAPGGAVFLPYVWAILKSYFERHGSHVASVDWLDPLFDRGHVLSQAHALSGTPIDLIGLSCYTWNWQLNLELARCLKETHPNALVVAGGPDPDYKDPEFFHKFPEIDAVVIKDGEVPFTRILDSMVEGSLDFKKIPGLCIPPRLSESLAPSNDCAEWFSKSVFTGNAEPPVAFDHSPYLMQMDRLSEMATKRGGHAIAATLETNRGCPYSCNYCDWGSATMTRLRKFEIDRVRADIQTLANLQVNWIFQADSNFGILPRDFEITDFLVESHEQHGFPQSLVYSPAKNNPERTVEISRRLHSGGLITEHWLAVQHTDEGVLKTADRSNISPEKYREVALSLRNHGIPCYPQLILGMPGDTPDKWKSCLATMMQWGIHDHYWVSMYSLLPNAPAAEPEFLRSWQVETIDRELVDAFSLRLKEHREAVRSKIVIAFKGYTKNDWVECSTYTAQIRGLHNLAVLRLPAIYLKFSHGVSYRDFYDAVIDDFFRMSEPWRSIQEGLRAVYRRILENPDAVDDYPLKEFPDMPFYVNPSKGVFIEVASRIGEFMKGLTLFLSARFPKARALASVLNYQRQLVLTPEKKPTRCHKITMHHDWPSYFDAIEQGAFAKKIPEPKKFIVPRSTTVPVPDRLVGLGIGAANDPMLWIKHILASPNTVALGNYLHPKRP